MAIKIYKPTSAGRRKHSVTDYSVLTQNPTEAPRNLFRAKKRSGGRNAHGKITVRHIGGGFKKIVRVVDSKREKLDIPARIASLEYDPGRSAFLSLLVYRDGEKRYIVAPANAKIGDVIVASEKTVEIKPGNRTRITNVPSGTFVHDIELTPGRGGQMAKGAGNYAIVTAVEGGMAILKLPSGEMRKVFGTSMATIGQVSNNDHMNVRVGKAGRKRLMGIRPTVRGKAMNPVDHPHGGGEGRNPIGMKYPKTPWGKHALGVHTRRKHKSSDKFIVQRRKK